jgi:hypothetical protein
MNKNTQKARILAALRKAGRNGLTTMELSLAVQSNCVWRRVAEMPIWHMIGNARYYIDRSSRVINSRRVRVYRLVRV